MSAIGTNTSTQACWPLVNCVVSQLLQAMLLTQQTCCSSSMSWTLFAYTHVAECLQRAFIPVSSYVKDIKIHQDFPELWSQMCCHVFSYSKSVLWVWNVIVSFSRGSVSTLLGWGGHIFHVCKTFLPVYSNAKIIKIKHVCPELWWQMCCPFFRFTVYS